MKSVGFRVCVITLVACLSTFCSSKSLAQSHWRKIGHFGIQMSAAYFWDTTHGVIAGNTDAAPGIVPVSSGGVAWYTTDGGVSWGVSQFPSDPGTIAALRYLPNNRLYACGNTGLYESTDFGVTWICRAPSLQFVSDVYLDSSGQVQTLNYGYNGYKLSAFARISRLRAIYTNDDAHIPNYTTDGGTSWWSTGHDIPFFKDLGGFGCGVDTCHGIMYATGEASRNIAISLDSGVLWDESSNFPTGFSGDVLEVCNSTLYVQGVPGMIRSIDNGSSWQFIGGPHRRSGQDDRHFCVFGRFAQNVVACDTSTDIYLTTDGGGTPPFRNVIDTTGSCKFVRIPLDIPFVTSADSATITIIGDSLHVLSLEGHNPYYLASGAGNVIYIDRNANQPIPTYTVTIDISLSNPTSCNIQYPIRLTILSIPDETVSSAAKAALSGCDSTLIPVYLTAGSCDSLRLLLDTLTGAPPGVVSLLHQLPRIIPALTIDTFWIKCAPHGADGNFAYSLHLVAMRTYSGTLLDTIIPITVQSFGQPGTNLGYPKALSLTPCNNGLLPLAITAPGCRSVQLDSISLTDTAKLLHWTRTLPFIVQRGTTDTLPITVTTFGHQGVLPTTMRLHFHYLDSGVPFDSNVVISITIVSASDIGLAYPSKQSLSACSNSSFPFVITASRCKSIFLDSVSFGDQLSLLKLDSIRSQAMPDSIPAGERDTLIFKTLSVGKTGSDAVYMTLHFRSASDGKRIDSVVVLNFTIAPLFGPTFKYPVQMQLSSCTSGSLALIVTSPECKNLILDSITTVDTARVLTTNAADLAQLPYPIPKLEHDTIHFDVNPVGHQGAVSVFVKLHFRYADTGIPFDSVVRFTFLISSVRALLVPSTDDIELDSISTCSFADTSFQFTNHGCDTISVNKDLTLLNPGWKISHPAFPIVLPPDSSFWTNVHFAPGYVGKSTQYISYHFDGPGVRDVPAGDVFVAAVGQQGTGDIFFANSALDLGAFSICSSDSSFSLILRNNGCDSITLSMLKNSDSLFRTSVTLDTLLAPGDSSRMVVRFTPRYKGVYSGSIVIHTAHLRSGLPIRDTTIYFAAHVSDGARLATLATSDVAFNAATICESRDTSITISSNGCDTLTLSGISLSTAQYRLPDTLKFPIVLPPGTRTTIPIFSNFDTSAHPGSFATTLTTTSNADVGIPSLTLACPVVYPTRFGLAIGSVDSALIGKSISIPIDRTGAVPLSTSQLQFNVIASTDALKFESIDEPDIVLSGQTALPTGMTRYDLSFPQYKDRTRLATMHFVTTLEKNGYADIGLSGYSIATSSPLPLSCLAAEDSVPTSTRTGFASTCYQDVLRMQLRGEKLPLSIMAIGQDGISSQLILRIWNGTQSEQSSRIDVYDMLGILRRAETIASGPNESRAVVDMEGLGAGLYVVRMDSGMGSLSKTVVYSR